MKIIRKIVKKDFTLLMIFTLVFLIMFVGAVNTPSTAFYENFLDQNVLNGNTAGNVNNYGSFDYVQNVELPKGVNDLKPSLDIRYNSLDNRNSNSFIGNGFEISQYYIEREINYTLSNISDDFFILNFRGTSYDLKFDSLNANYHTKVETYLNINNTSGGNNTLGNYWIVKTEEGTSYRFGYNNYSEQISNQGNYVTRWYLDLINDTYGNKIYYSYNENPNSGDLGITYPNKIEYNNDKQRIIEFVFENTNTSDMRVIFSQGNKIRISRKLQNVLVKVNGSLIQNYSLVYKSAGYGKRFLDRIDVFGGNNSFYNSINFSYFGLDKGWAYNSTWASPIASSLSSRFVDVNRDGLVDIINGHLWKDYYDENQLGSSTIYINNKNGWSVDSGSFPTSLSVVTGYLPACDPDNPIGQGKYDRGGRFLDLNGDGFLDYVFLPDNSPTVGQDDGQSALSFLNINGSWSTNNSYLPPISYIVDHDRNNNFCDGPDGSFPYISGIDTGYRFVDIDNDGREDLVSLGSIYLNKEGGWQSSSDWSLPYSVVVSIDNMDCTSGGDDLEFYGVDNGVRFVDINGDGLVDFLYSNYDEGIKKVYLNNGKNFTYDPSWNIPIYFVKHDLWGDPACYTRYGVDQGVRFADVNADGLMDILVGFESTKDVYINNGSGWEKDTSFILPVSFVVDNYDSNGYMDSQVVPVDVNGDGITDLIYGTSGSYINNASKTYLLKNITTSFGGVISIDYKKSTYLNNTGNDNLSDLGFNVWVVSNITKNNSMPGSQNVVSVTNYNYSGGKYDYPGKEFRGFNYVEERTNDRINKHWFYQDNARKGLEYKSEILNSQNNIYQRNEQNWNYTDKGGYYVVNLLETSESTYNRTYANPQIRNVSYSYDNFGNTMIIYNKGDVLYSSDDKYEYFNYLNNSNSWIINKLKNYSLFNYNNSIKLKEIKYSYDQLQYGVAPNKGDITSKESWLNASQSIVYNYSYDTYGNLVNETNSRGYLTRYIYGLRDTTNTFADRVINAKSQIIDYNYSLGTGNLLWKKNSNGQFTNYTYDAFGRITQEINPYDNSTFPTVSYLYSFDGVAPEKMEVSKREQNGTQNTLDEYYFYDGFGNVVQTKSEADGNKQIIKDVYYDTNYRISGESNPYFISFYENYSSPNQTINKTNYTYNPLNQIIKVTNADNTSRNITYNGWNLTYYDENSNRKDYDMDAYNRIKYVREYSSGNIYNTTYFYDSSGNLIKIVDSLGNIFNWSYDSLDRNTKIMDPDIGTWNYSYDGENNLIEKTDNKGNKISKGYDQLNRVLYENSSTRNVTYIYDINKNNSLSQTKIDSITINNSYDNRLRKISEKKIIDGITFFTNWTYDSMNRIITEKLPSGETIIYAYNNHGLASSINNLVNISYNEQNQILSRSYGNNLITNYSYNGSNFRLTQIKTGNKQELNYSYDSLGNVKQINDSINLRFFSMNYDNLNRLILTQIINFSGSNDNKIMNFFYNSIGNMLNTSVGVGNFTFQYGALAHAPVRMIYSEGFAFDNFPTTTLISPADNSTDTDGNVIFNCSATDDKNLVNITLYGNWSGSWIANETKSLTGISNSTTFTKNLLNGKYKWNCKSFDNASQASWGDTNRTIIINISSPSQNASLTYTQVSTNNTIAGQITRFSINVSDNTALNPNGRYIFSTNNTGIWTNDSAVNFTGNWPANLNNGLVHYFKMDDVLFPYINSSISAASGKVTIVSGSQPLTSINFSNGGILNKSIYWNTTITGPVVRMSFNTLVSNQTISMWVKPDNSSAAMGFLMSYNGGNIRERIYTDANTGYLNWFIYNGVDIFASSTVKLNQSQWNHIVAIKGTGGMKLYLNNVLVGTNAYAGYGLTPATLDLGGTYQTMPSPKAFMDEVAFWNRSLSEDEISTIYREGLASGYAGGESNSSWVNVTKTLNTTVGLRIGYRWYLTDNAGNKNSTPIYVLTTSSSSDTTAPYFITIPANASLFYGNQSLLVQFIGADAVGFGYYRINDTRFLINQTGFLSNATPMAFGTYTINVTINDTSNNINWTFYKVQVNKSTYYNCGVYFNATSPIIYPTNFIVYTNCSSAYMLYRDGTSIANASTVNSGAGYYNLTVQRTDTANYTNTLNSRFFTVNKNAENCLVLFNETSPLTYPKTFLVWANCTTPFVLRRNGTTISNNSVQSLAVGAYNFSMSRNDSLNYTMIFNQSQFIVNSGSDSTPPTYTQVSVNNTASGQITRFSIYVADNSALHTNGQYIFSTNNSGSWINDSTVNFTTTPSWANVTKTLNSTVGMRVGYRWYLTDNAGNKNSTFIYELTTTGSYNYSWITNTTINASLPTMPFQSSTPTIFQKDGSWYLISGDNGGLFYGYVWNGTQWKTNLTINASLPDIGTASTPYVFQKNGNWYIISGNLDGLFYGYVWGGTQWSTNLTINASLPYASYYSAPSVFYKDSSWYLISGAYDGNFYGYVWSGTQWVSNSTIIASLPDIGTNSKPSVFQKDGIWYLISGESAGIFYGYAWNGTGWNVNTAINASLPNMAYDSAPYVFYKDSSWYLISGSGDGNFYGYTYAVI